ncbi:MAG TPA: class I SAM-dependent methyltransferase [Gaiellaceae bacterium]|nr:class I SAM-dependent methyltransferase [Gaiellaceae bacterium]
MPDPRTQIVSAGYDAIGETFAAWRRRIVGDPRDEWAEELVARLDDGARVLELGCGSGSPETRRLAQRFAVTGVDISPRQVERARAAIPGASFTVADLTELELPPASYDAVVSFYVFNHVPRDLLAPLLGRIRDWLVPGGWLLSAFGVSDLESWTGDWLGAPTFFSSFPAEVNSRLVREAGFTLERDEVVVFEEPEGQAKFQWVLARA